MARAALAQPGNEGGAELDATGTTMWFHHNNGASSDLFVSMRSGGAFAIGLPITELNSGSEESDPTLAGDLRTIVFRRGNALFLSTR